MTDKTNLRAQAEAKLALAPEPLAATSPAETQRLLHDLRVHQIELEMQNEELHTALDALRLSEAELRGASRDITAQKQAEAERKNLQAQLEQAQKMESVGRLAKGVAHDFNNLLMGLRGYAAMCREMIEPGHPIREYLDEITSTAQRSAIMVRQLLVFTRKQTIAPKILEINSQAELPRGRGETILLVDDEKSVRVTCGQFLKLLNYKVLTAATPGEALNMADRHPGDIHALLTDVVMPEMDGGQLAKRIAAVKPGVKVLFMSGYTPDVVAERSLLGEGKHFITKPFTRNDLAHKMREILQPH